ncbi:MAG: acyl-CoA synthetase, partial [Actinomadura rubrobrunea]|nr:acyl-CoA synthetase [Actinomadura rubrobrunea]
MARATFAELLLDRAADDRVGLRFEDESYTWAETVRAAGARARMLRDLHPSPGG